MSLRSLLQNVYVRLLWKPNQRYASIAEESFNTIFGEVSSAFEASQYEKDINYTHVLIFCTGLNVGTFRIFHKKERPVADVSNGLLQAINYHNFNRVYKHVKNNFGFNNVNEAKQFYEFRVNEYSYALEEGRYDSLALIFLEKALREQVDIVLYPDLNTHLSESAKRLVSDCHNIYQRALS